MVTLRILGGLGNQMFQYAAGKALALRSGKNLRLDTHWFQHIPEDQTPRNYELSIFKNITAPTGSFLNFFQRNRFQRTHQIISKILFDYETSLLHLYYEDQNFRLEEFLSPKKKYYNLNGYWQSEKYFEDYKEQIRKDFTFPELEDPGDIDFLSKIKDCTAVSLHVRRGDYISPDGTQTLLGGICTKEYYQTAIELIKQRVGTLVFAVFSDDVNWARENLHLPEDTLFVDWHSGKNSFRDMQLMSLCSNHIIANSSFSWWGAWLGNNPEKIVIAPKKWMNVDDPQNDYRCPESWIRL